ncbi:MAG: hypothetical protein IPF53_12655 [Blastocatellia bacterium]|nr:hypothetical protein [Blastocatellia bacterium]
MTAPIRRARRYVLALTFLVLHASPALSRVPVNSVFEIFTRTTTGEFTRVAIGVQIKPGIVVTVRDERRVGTDIFVRGNFSNRYLAASSIETGHPSDLDVYSVEGSGTSTLRFKPAAAMTTGDAVYLLSVPGGGQPGVVRSIQDDVFAIALTQPAFFPLPGAPVMLDDGTSLASRPPLWFAKTSTSWCRSRGSRRDSPGFRRRDRRSRRWVRCRRCAPRDRGKARRPCRSHDRHRSHDRQMTARGVSMGHRETVRAHR